MRRPGLLTKRESTQLAAASASALRRKAHLDQDRMIASRFGLRLHAVQGDMACLGAFADGSFDPIFPSALEQLRPVSLFGVA
jgi:hypothetical protein